jgi:hypothetical protein
MSLMRRRDLLKRSASALLASALAQTGRLAHAEAPGRAGIELSRLLVQRGDDGAVLLSYEVRFDLPADIESALSKGVAVVFVAEATLMRPRWYWMDQARVVATRRWRLAYQPLTRKWRLNFDGLSRSYNRMSDALDVIRRSTQWRIADSLVPADDQDHYVDFSFKLDTDELPRPMQIGLGSQTDWNLAVQRRVPAPPSH